MIQRIQTLWLAFVVLLTGASFFFPIAEFSFDYKGNITGTYGLLPENNTIYQIINNVQAYEWSLIFMQIGVALFALVAIFLYKKRPLQLKVVAGGMLLLTIYIAFLIFVKIDSLEDKIAELLQVTVKTTYNKISIMFPVLQVLLLILTQRAIRKDERIVRSSERLR
mgnify:FL=1